MTHGQKNIKSCLISIKRGVSRHIFEKYANIDKVEQWYVRHN